MVAVTDERVLFYHDNQVKNDFPETEATAASTNASWHWFPL